MSVLDKFKSVVNFISTPYYFLYLLDIDMNYLELNDLYYCRSCESYSRKYQMDFRRELDSSYDDLYDEFISGVSLDEYVSNKNFPCPHCESLSNSLYTSIEHKWMKHIDEAPKLSAKQLVDIIRRIDKIVDLEIEDQSVSDFISHNNLIGVSKR